MTEFSRKANMDPVTFPDGTSCTAQTQTRPVTTAEHAGLHLLLLFSTWPGQLSSSLSASARWGDSQSFHAAGHDWLANIVRNRSRWISDVHQLRSWLWFSTVYQCFKANQRQEFRFSRFLGWLRDFTFQAGYSSKLETHFQHACKKSYSSYTWFIFKMN